mmetsp:Transcript_14437/g.24868  ORF Transcript_14437/g.24868 Transcript_14437/m.24868 type:complete len:268 (+) Transcript_14437:45-848(+)
MPWECEAFWSAWHHKRIESRCDIALETEPTGQTSVIAVPGGPKRRRSQIIFVIREESSFDVSSGGVDGDSCRDGPAARGCATTGTKRQGIQCRICRVAVMASMDECATHHDESAHEHIPLHLLITHSHGHRRPFQFVNRAKRGLSTLHKHIIAQTNERFFEADILLRGPFWLILRRKYRVELFLLRIDQRSDPAHIDGFSFRVHEFLTCWVSIFVRRLALVFLILILLRRIGGQVTSTHMSHDSRAGLIQPILHLRKHEFRQCVMRT